MNNKRAHLVNFRGNRSQAAMAKQYGITQQAWSAWECGESTPSPTLMLKLEVDTGIPMEEIFADVFYPKNTDREEKKQRDNSEREQPKKFNKRRMFYE